jgi:hypothetical protein
MTFILINSSAKRFPLCPESAEAEPRNVGFAGCL